MEQPTMDDTDTDTLLADSNDEINVKASERSVAKPRQRSVANNDGNFSCNECEATFSRQWLLTRHKQSKHEGEIVEADGRYICEQ